MGSSCRNVIKGAMWNVIEDLNASSLTPIDFEEEWAEWHSSWFDNIEWGTFFRWCIDHTTCEN